MKWGDVELLHTSTGEEYIQYTERATKTRTGLTSNTRPFQPKMFAISGDSRCPVNAYKEYARRRPSDLNESSYSAFYLSVNPNYRPSSAWYSRQNMGKKQDSKYNEKHVYQRWRPGKKGQPFGEETTVTTLLHSGIAPTQIMQVTGHKNVNSINSYSSASVQQQKEMSKLLSALSTEQETEKENVSESTNVSTQMADNDDAEMSKAAAEIENTLQSIESDEAESTVINLPLQVGKNIPSVIDLPVKVNSSSNSTTSSSTGNYLFTGAHIEGDVTIKMNCKVVSETAVKKRPIRVIDSQSDSD